MNFVNIIFRIVFVGTIFATQATYALPPVDETGAIDEHGAYSPPASSTLEGVFADATALSSDDRIVTWVSLAADQDYEALLDQTEADLRGENPHPFTTHVWSWAAFATGKISLNGSDIPEDLADILTLPARAYLSQYYNRTDEGALVAKELAARTRVDYWADAIMAYDAVDMGLPDVALTLRKRLMRHFPNDLMVFRAAIPATLDGYADMIAFLDGDPQAGGGAGAAFLRWRLANSYLNPADKIAVLREWESAAPDDANLHRFLGYALEKRDFWYEGAEAFIRGHRRYPFYYTGTQIGRNVARLQDVDARLKDAAASLQDSDLTREWLISLTYRDTPAAHAPAILKWRMSKALRGAGEYGQAREAIVKAAELDPDLPEIAVEHARVVLGEGFPQEALDILDPHSEALPAHLDVAKVHVNALYNLKQYDDVLRRFETFRAAGGRPDSYLLRTARISHSKAGRSADALAMTQMILNIAPDAVDLIEDDAYDLSKLGRFDEALEHIKTTLDRSKNPKWLLGRLTAYAKEIGTEADAVAYLREYVTRRPGEEEAWDQIAALSPDSEAVWREAVIAAPRMAWPIKSLALDIAGKDLKNWEDAVKIITEGIAFLSDNGAEPSQIGKLFDSRSYFKDEAFRRKLTGEVDGVEDLDIVYRALEDNDVAKDDYLSRGDFWKYRYDLFTRIPYIPRRAIAAFENAKYHPDDHYATTNILRHGISSSAGRKQIGFAALDRHIRRKPRDLDRLLEGARYHNLYGGSPIRALYFTSQAKRWHPDADVNNRENESYSRLGLSLDEVRIEYTEATSISDSLFYFGWYDTARADALKEQNTILRLDLENTAVTLLRPDGIVEERHHHPVHGGGTYLRIGAAEMHVSYTDDHYLDTVKIGTTRSAKVYYDYKENDSYAYRAYPRIRNEFTEEITRLHLGHALAGFPTGDADILDYVDHDLTEMRDAVRSKAGQDTSDERIALSQHLIERLSNAPGFAEEAETQLLHVLTGAGSAVSSGNDSSSEMDAILRLQATLSLFELYHVWRAGALPEDRWNTWRDLIEHALAPDDREGPDFERIQNGFREILRKNPLRMLSRAGWLNGTSLGSPGLWRQYEKNAVFPRALGAKVGMTSILLRRNGDVVVGSTHGFSVLRRGFWEWFAFDRSASRFSRSVDYADVDAASRVTSLAEDDDGRLWLGLATGIALLVDDYEGLPKLMRSGQKGLFGGPVETLAIDSEALWAGGDGGVSAIILSDLSIRPVNDQPTARLRTLGEGRWLAMERSNLAMLRNDGRRIVLVDHAVSDALHDGEQLYALKGPQLISARWGGDGALRQDMRPVPGEETIQSTAAPYGLSFVPLEGDREAMAVLTDMGASIYGHGSFEQLTLPRNDRSIGFRHISSRDGRHAVVTSAGIAINEGGQARIYDTGRVHDLETDPVLGVTYVAQGNALGVVSHEGDEAGRLVELSSIKATRMDLASDGGLIVNDGGAIVRFDQGETIPRDLFDVSSYVEDEIESILAASDGSVWVSAGLLVYHWRGSGALDEFSIGIDDTVFPVNSNQIGEIIETVDGRILLVASNNSHIPDGQGRPLAGGLFEFADGKFQKVPDDDVLGRWFLTSYTDIGDGNAILGTTGGFARHKANGKIEEFDLIDNDSYNTLRDRRPALYMGTEGARLGEDVWLFGSASGVTGYHRGKWFDPDRINWMLPRQDYADYGARTVHAVETDPTGRVYVGTDHGLTIYDPRGASAISFLVAERRTDDVFISFEEERMRAVNDVLLDALPEDSKKGKFAALLRKTREQEAELERKLAQSMGRDTAATRKLDKQMIRIRQRELNILGNLRETDPTLYNMLALDPLDLQAVARKLPEDVVVAQYLPSKERLYINLVSRDEISLREVDVKATDLMQAARDMAAALREQALSGEDSVPVTSLGGGLAAASMALMSGQDVSAESPSHGETLTWLYDQLLRPIEHAVAIDDTLVISPAGALAYIPFAALRRNANDANPGYAVERFTFAMAPSLYSIDLLIEKSHFPSDSHIVFGDPDGNLPGARVEAQKVAEMLEPDVVKLRLGEEANYEELLKHVGDARFVHMAMHGKLDHRSPRNSYLRLAQGRRMTLPQIMTLPLDNAELVFLSACETGVGADGLEFSTIAHAFAHAGALSTVATLWKVDDKATRELSTKFYEARMEGKGTSLALATAQRQMIKGKGAYTAPGFWSGFTVLGKP